MDAYKVIEKLVQDEEGATMVEYALMVGLIAAVCVVAITALSPSVSGLFVIPWP